MRFVIALLTAGLIAVAPSARADERELYTTLQAGPAFLWLSDPLTNAQTSFRPGLATQLSAYYGVTNWIHLGASANFGYARDAQFSPISVYNPTLLTGTLYENVVTLGASVFALCRFDTGYPVAPVLRIDGGFVHSWFTDQQLAYGDNYGSSLPSTTDTSLYAAATLAAEYRFAERFILSLGVSGRRTFGTLGWDLSVPLSVGIIW